MELKTGSFIDSALSKDPLCPECFQLILLCERMDYFPSEDQQVRALVAKLHQISVDHGHASRIIGLWIEKQTIAPKVANLISIAGETTEGSTLPEGCSICKGDYWIETPHGVDRCNCSRGQALRRP